MMVDHILLVVGQAQTVDVAGEGAEAALEGQRDVGAAQLAVLYHVIDLQVRVEEGALLLDLGTDFEGGLFNLLLEVGFLTLFLLRGVVVVGSSG